MGVPGTKPSPDGPKRFRGAPTHDWTEVPDRLYRGKVPVKIPARRELAGESVPTLAATKRWWTAVRRMPHCRLWSETDWHYALITALIADLAFRGSTSAATELRQREKTMGTTVDARRDLRIKYVEPPKKSSSGTKKKSAGKATAANVTNIADRRNRLTDAS